MPSPFDMPQSCHGLTHPHSEDIGGQIRQWKGAEMPSDTSSSWTDISWLNAVIKRLQEGEAASLIKETLEALAQDQENLQLLQTVSLAYTYQAQGDRAEPYARQALEAIVKDSRAAPLHVEIAYMGLYDSLVAQAKYVEAARVLGPALKRAPHTNSMLLLIAWSYFLAEDMQAVRDTLRRSVPNDPSTTGSDEIAASLPSFHYLIGPYMRYTLEIYPRRLQSNPLSKQLLTMMQQAIPKEMTENKTRLVAGILERLEGEARRNAHNPYGRRLNEIVTRMRPLDWLTEYEDRSVWG